MNKTEYKRSEEFKTINSRYKDEDVDAVISVGDFIDTIVKIQNIASAGTEGSEFDSKSILFRGENQRYDRTLSGIYR